MDNFWVTRRLSETEYVKHQRDFYAGINNISGGILWIAGANIFRKKYMNTPGSDILWRNASRSMVRIPGDIWNIGKLAARYNGIILPMIYVPKLWKYNTDKRGDVDIPGFVFTTIFAGFMQISVNVLFIEFGISNLRGHDVIPNSFRLKITQIVKSSRPRIIWWSAGVFVYSWFMR